MGFWTSSSELDIFFWSRPRIFMAIAKSQDSRLTAVLLWGVVNCEELLDEMMHQIYRQISEGGAMGWGPIHIGFFRILRCHFFSFTCVYIYKTCKFHV